MSDRLKAVVSLISFQIRSHAQKYFLKVQKHGGTEFIPPARPKRKVSPADGSSSTRRSPEQAQPSPPALVSNALTSQLHSNPSAMFSHWMSANGLAPPAGLLMPAPVFPHAPPSGPLHPLAPILTPNHDEIARLRRTQEQFAQAQLSLSNAMSAAAPSCPAPPGAPPQRTHPTRVRPVSRRSHCDQSPTTRRSTPSWAACSIPRPITTSRRST